MLFWSNFLLLLETGAQSTSPHLIPWRRAGCEHRTKCVRSLIYITGKYYLNYKREQIRLLHSLFLALFPGFLSLRLFPFFSFFVLATPATDHPHGAANGGAKYWSYSLFSFLALPGQSAATTFYPLLPGGLCCGSGDSVAGCSGLLASALDCWCAVACEPAAFEEFIVGAGNLLKCT